MGLGKDPERGEFSGIYDWSGREKEGRRKLPAALGGGELCEKCIDLMKERFDEEAELIEGGI